jgi:hypothetical protein
MFSVSCVLPHVAPASLLSVFSTILCVICSGELIVKKYTQVICTGTLQ